MTLLLLLLLPLAIGREVLLRNDQTWDDTFGEDDEVVLLEYPECAVAVLTPAPEDYPLRVHTIEVYLGSSLGNQDRQITMLTMAMQILEEGEDPRIMGYSQWDWPETAFWVTVSSEYLNGLGLDDPASGIYPLTVESGRIAVFVCAPDPEWKDGISWPCTTPGEDCSGLVVEGGSPSEGSWIVTDGPEATPLAETGMAGAWVIRAVGEGPDLDDTAVPDDTGAPVALALEAISPDWAPLGQATMVTLSGAGFAEGATTTTIGGLAVADLTWVDADTLTGRSPSGLPAGAHDLVVTNPDGERALLLDAFAVVAEEEGRCGCGGGVGTAWLALLAPLWVRRRRDG